MSKVLVSALKCNIPFPPSHLLLTTHKHILRWRVENLFCFHLVFMKEFFKKSICILETNSTGTREPEVNENNEKKNQNKKISNQKYKRNCFYLHTKGASLQCSTPHHVLLIRSAYAWWCSSKIGTTTCTWQNMDIILTKAERINAEIRVLQELTCYLKQPSLISRKTVSEYWLLSQSNLF